MNEEANLFRIILVKCDAEVALDFIAHDNMSKPRPAFAVVVERREVGLFEWSTVSLANRPMYRSSHPGSVKMWGLITEAEVKIVASIDHNTTTQRYQNNAISTTPQHSAPCPRATRGIASLRVIFCAI